MVRVLGVTAGIVMVVYLVWAELFRVDAVCLWDPAVHVCTIGLFVAVLWPMALGSQPQPDGDGVAVPHLDGDGR